MAIVEPGLPFILDANEHEKSISSQLVNHFGKCIYLNYDAFKVSMSVHPLPCYDRPIVDTIYRAEKTSVESFIVYYGVQIIYQDLKNTKCVGLWISHVDLPTLSYIPIVPNKPFRNIKRAPPSLFAPGPVFDMMTTDQPSAMERSRRTDMAARILMEYTLWEYAHRVLESGNGDDSEFDADRVFVIDPLYRYDLESLDGRLIKPSTLYRNDQLIVGSREIAVRLVSYAKNIQRVDPVRVHAYRHYTFLQTIYDRPSDLVSQHQQESVFDFPNHGSISTYIAMRSVDMVSSTIYDLQANQKKALVYGHPDVNMYQPTATTQLGLCMAQCTVTDSYNDAVKIAWQWDRDRINAGWDGVDIDVDTIDDIRSIHIYDQYEKTWRRELINDENRRRIFLIEYSTGLFAALLPLDVHRYI